MTIRRCLVLVVCAVGVGALYLAPGLARTPGQVGAGRLDDEPPRSTTSRSGTGATPAPGSAVDVSTSDGSGTDGSGAGTGSDPVPSPSDQPNSTVDATRPSSTPLSSRSPSDGGGGQPSTAATTAYDPPDTDREPPQPVHKIRTETVTANRLGLSWPASRDNVRVVGYHIWLNGFEVASTAETHASVRWFNDDTATHVVQVKAVDEAGNESQTSPTVLVTRPEPEPEPSTPAPSTPAPEPEPTPEPTPETSTRPGGAPAADPTSEPTAPARAPDRTP